MNTNLLVLYLFHTFEKFKIETNIINYLNSVNIQLFSQEPHTMVTKQQDQQQAYHPSEAY